MFAAILMIIDKWCRQELNSARPLMWRHIFDGAALGWASVQSVPKDILDDSCRVNRSLKLSRQATGGQVKSIAGRLRAVEVRVSSVYAGWKRLSRCL